MNNITTNPFYIKVSEATNGFLTRYLERVKKQEERVKASKINSVIQNKLTQELKLNEELQSKLAEVMKKTDELDKICSSFSSGLTISERDQQRLDKVKEMYTVGKQITGVRFDYSAPPDVVKGYIKSETRRTLTPFEMTADDSTSEKLWDMIDKENEMPNKE